jgi:hypothetical protein
VSLVTDAQLELARIIAAESEFAVAVVIQQNPFWRLSLGGQNQCGQKDEKRKRMR